MIQGCPPASKLHRTLCLPMLSTAVQACNRQNMYCVPLYDSLGEVRRAALCMLASAAWSGGHAAAWEAGVRTGSKFLLTTDPK